jgi:dipeptidase E
LHKRILLLSSSSVSGSNSLDYAEEVIHEFFGDTKRVLFFPYALADRASYFARVEERLGRMGYKVEGIHEASSPGAAIEKAEAVFVGGGNTFRLLKTMYDLDLLGVLRDRVEAGAAYLGSSAGSNLACPTICTTNDMPIVEPPSFAALGLIPMQINPHYLDPDPNSTHMGETREERILQFLEENETPVIGLREGAWLRLERGEGRLGGTNGARLFQRDAAPRELRAGATVFRL